MRYFHRTSLSPDDVLNEADRFFAERLPSSEREARGRVFAGTLGRIGVHVHAEGGHYTLVVAETDDVGESEADKLAKRFLTMVHKRREPTSIARGAY
jgi:hypothetical protein